MQMGTLRVFCDVVESKSFSRAAQKNARTTTNASQLFRALEVEFGVRLALRDPLLFQLTTAGEICHAHCLEMLRLDRELDRQMQRARETSANIFELAACFSLGLHQLQPILRQHRRTFPHIQIHDRYAHIDRVHELVLHNEVDIGLVAYPRRLPGLAVERVRDEPLALVCHPQHRFAARPAVLLPTLRNQPIVAWKEIPWTAFLKKIPGSQRHLFEPRHVFNEVEMVKQAVERDIGVAVLPAATVAAEVANRLLAAVPFEDGRHTKPVAVIYRKNRKLTPAMKNFIQALKQAA